MIIHGDLFDVLPTLDAESIDACATDPPYGLNFMGKEWDRFGVEVAGGIAMTAGGVNPKAGATGRAHSHGLANHDGVAFQMWCKTWAREVYRVLKPGAHLVAFGGTRTFHRLTCALEDAGFEIRDCLSWLYGSGFPKSLNVGEGRGTALKPGWEPIVLARKPLAGTVAANVTKHGTGALNIEACRIDGGERTHIVSQNKGLPRNAYSDGGGSYNAGTFDLGRWPANVLLDEEAAALLDAQSGELASGDLDFARHADSSSRQTYGGFPNGDQRTGKFGGDAGGASRFYYVAKPSREERDMGCDRLPLKTNCDISGRSPEGAGLHSPRAGALRVNGGRNSHPTVKPIELMRWLVRLVTPPGGTVLDPFLGSGTTACACVYEQREYIGVEREAEYVEIAKARIAACAPLFHSVVSERAETRDEQPSLFSDEVSG